MTKLHKIIAVLCALVAALVVTLFRMQIGIMHQNDPTQRLERGRYLVENVAMCADCHAPRLATGELDRSRWLQGRTLEFKPAVEMPWASVAPSITGMPGYSEEQAVVFLTTGLRPNGTICRPPMPAYQLSREDAAAVVTYLKSLPAVR